LYDPNKDRSLQMLLDVVTYEQLKELYCNLYHAYQELKLKYEDLNYNQSREAIAKQAERSGGWINVYYPLKISKAIEAGSITAEKIQSNSMPVSKLNSINIISNVIKVYSLDGIHALKGYDIRELKVPIKVLEESELFTNIMRPYFVDREFMYMEDYYEFPPNVFDILIEEYLFFKDEHE
jgi:hypothetical protein